ncbi:MAG: cysteine desulfurase NifS [Ignavibacteriae bacterium HGW-Ignavibacteriae-2]|nr:MAG: cysteine desulfurase NifS [Ignavibacteriae bacterium HGW-Ignavibacteriae-2]
MLDKIYFDNAATTPIHPKVKEKILPYLSDYFGNPSSIHSYGRIIRVAIEEAREIIADFINADASEIYFTSGGTEADNFAIFGISKTEFTESGRNKIITSKSEHHAVLDSFEELGKSGFNTEYVGVNQYAQLNVSELEKTLDSGTSLVAAMHTNNETGALNSIRLITELTKRNKSYIHVDAVQGFAKNRIDVKNFGFDSMAASAHKFYGPKGVGFLYAKSGTPLSPLLYGGSQERNRRGGTENIVGIVGLAEAVKIADLEMETNNQIVSDLKKYFIEGINSISLDEFDINTKEDTSPYILSVTLKSEYYRVDPEAMLMFLDINGVAASNGAACTSGTLKPSHVMLSAGKSIEDASGTIRFSFNPNNTKSEIDYTIDVLKKLRPNFVK